MGKFDAGEVNRRLNAVIESRLCYKQASIYLRQSGGHVKVSTLTPWIARFARVRGFDINQLLVHHVIHNMPAPQRHALLREAVNSMRTLQGLELKHRNAFSYVGALVGKGLRTITLEKAAESFGMSEDTLRRAHRAIGGYLGTHDGSAWLRLLCSLYLYARAHPEVLESQKEPFPSA